MNLKEQYQQETGQAPSDNPGFNYLHFLYVCEYTKWLESKVLSQTPQPEDNAIQRVLAKLEAHKDHYGTQYPQLETWLKEELQTPQPKDVKPEVWISCETQMPKYNERVLVCGSGAGVFIAELKEKPIHNEDGWAIEGETDGITILDYITNWKPLPEGTLF